MQKKAAIFLALLLAAGIAFLYHMGCGISMFAKVTANDSTGTHSGQDIRKAISIARKEFRNLNGCIMTEIHYSEEKTQQLLEEKRVYGYSSIGSDWDDVIVLDSDFTTSRLFSEPTFNGCTQRGWDWIITHTEAEGWKLAGSGYA